MQMHPRLSRLCGFGLAAASLVLAGACHGQFTGPGPGDDPGGDLDAGDPPGDGPADAASGGGDEPDAGETGDEPDAASGGGDDDLEWHEANLTNFESYPAPGSDECEDFNGCEWEGRFAFVDGKQSENWVMMHNILAVHSRDGDEYGLKTLRLRKDGNEIDAVVYDVCSDSDCGGCCTRNAEETGFLIDIEKYTMERFGSGDGIVEWACVDCD